MGHTGHEWKGVVMARLYDRAREVSRALSDEEFKQGVAIDVAREDGMPMGPDGLPLYPTPEGDLARAADEAALDVLRDIEEAMAGVTGRERPGWGGAYEAMGALDRPDSDVLFPLMAPSLRELADTWERIDAVDVLDGEVVVMGDFGGSPATMPVRLVAPGSRATVNAQVADDTAWQVAVEDAFSHGVSGDLAKDALEPLTLESRDLVEAAPDMDSPFAEAGIGDDDLIEERPDAGVDPREALGSAEASDSPEAAKASARSAAWGSSRAADLARRSHGRNPYESIGTPERMLAWRDAAESELVGLAARDFPPPAGPGGYYDVTGSGDYVSEADFESVLPGEYLGTLYLALTNDCAEARGAAGAAGRPVAEFCDHLGDIAWTSGVASASVDGEGSCFYTEFLEEDYPEGFEDRAAKSDRETERSPDEAFGPVAGEAADLGAAAEGNAPEAGGQITVCVGNYGYYNEGELRDKWITLPKSEREISDFLKGSGLMDAEHEETYISDYDGIPLGMGYGGAFSEYTSLEDLNLLARAMEEADPAGLERLEGAFRAGAEQPDSVIGVANLVAQADEVPYQEYPHKPGEHGVSSAREAYALYHVEEMGGPEALGRETLEELFDVESYGRDRAIDSVCAGIEGWCWRDGLEGPDTEAFGSAAAAAEEMGLDGGGLGEEVATVDELGQEAAPRPVGDLTDQEVRTQLARMVGYSPSPADPVPHGLASEERTLLVMADGLDAFSREAVRAFVDNEVSYPNGAAEVASVIAHSDQIDYRRYSSDASNLDLRVGETLVEEFGMESVTEDDLETHLDYDALGGRAEDSGVVLGDEGFIEGDMPADDFYSKEELIEMYMPEEGREGATDRGLSPSVGEMVSEAAAAQGGAHEDDRSQGSRGDERS